MNRKRVLWPLLLVAAFGLGVIVAQVQADSIFLPLVASASTGEETSTPTTTATPTTPLPTATPITPVPTSTVTPMPTAIPPPSGTVRVENVHYNASGYEFLGELVNETACTVRASRVTLYLFDGMHQPVGTETGRSMAPILLSGQRTPFEVYWYDPFPAWDSYVIVADWDPIDRLTIESAVLTKGRYDLWQVTATVRNQLPVRVQSLTVGMVLYGPEGQVIGYDKSWESLGPLAPEDTLVVTYGFYDWEWDPSIEPVGCAVFAVPSGGSLYSLMEQEHEQTDSE